MAICSSTMEWNTPRRIAHLRAPRSRPKWLFPESLTALPDFAQGGIYWAKITPCRARTLTGSVPARLFVPKSPDFCGIEDRNEYVSGERFQRIWRHRTRPILLRNQIA